MTTPSPAGTSDAAILALVVRFIHAYDDIRFPGLDAATRLTRVPGLDSLRQLEVVAQAEQHYGVEIDTDRLETIVTVGDIVEAVSTALRAASG